MARDDDLKACCAAAYSSDVVALLLGDSCHPGGTTLTRRLADALGLAASGRVLDVASGRGTTALLLADAYGVRVDGVDYSPANTALAQGTAAATGLTEQVAFTTGDSDQLPYPDGTFDAVVCECALCTFPDKAKAAAEFARVLKPGGRLGITDVTAAPDRLPPKLTTLAPRIACIADARPLAEYTEILGPGRGPGRPERGPHRRFRRRPRLRPSRRGELPSSLGAAHDVVCGTCRREKGWGATEALTVGLRPRFGHEMLHSALASGSPAVRKRSSRRSGNVSGSSRIVLMRSILKERTSSRRRSQASTYQTGTL
nr:class I SAM-dependent methyltransferase [Streptomyces cupreus]